MKINKKIAAVIVGALTTTGLGILVTNPIPEKEYTVLLYMVGSDLESDSQHHAASEDLKEIENVISEYRLEDKVNVVAEIGGAKEWNLEELKEVSYARISIGNEGIEVLHQGNPQNMGEADTLSDFIEYGMTQFPARQNILILWNHGNGPTDGFGYDLLFDGDSLTLEELSTALRSFEENKMDLIGFDACCMGNLETANVLAPYTDYMIASPATEEIYGWNYEWMQIFQKETIEIKDIGREIIETFRTFYQQEEKSTSIATLSCYDMDAYEILYEKLETFYTQLDDKSKDAVFQTLNQKRTQIPGYYSGNWIDEPYDLLDVQALHQEMDKTLWEENGLSPLLQDFVCFYTDTEQNRCGISMYLPSKVDAMDAKQILQYQNCGYDARYLQFVLEYARSMNQELDVEMDEIKSEVKEESKTVVFYLEQEWLDQIGTLYLATSYPFEQGQYYLLSTDSDVSVDENGKVTGVVDQMYFSIAGQVLCLVEQQNNEVQTIYHSPVYYNGELCSLIIEVSSRHEDGVIQGLTPYKEGQNHKEQYELSPGDTFAAAYPKIEESGEINYDQYYVNDTLTLQSYECELELTEVTFEECHYGLAW